jgi:hypothetical protein
MPTKTKTKRPVKNSTVAVKSRSKTPVKTKPQSTNSLKGKSKSEIRVMIAKDVLAQLKSKAYCAKQGCWVEDKKIGGFDDYCMEQFGGKQNVKAVSASEYVSKLKACKVCALGSIFVSQIRIGDDFKLSDTQTAYDVFEWLEKSPLKRYFSVDQLELLEACFEGLKGMYGESMYGANELLANAYASQFPQDKDRLTAIMKNIVRNNGQFIPEQDLTLEGVLKAAYID